MKLENFHKAERIRMAISNVEWAIKRLDQGAMIWVYESMEMKSDLSKGLLGDDYHEVLVNSMKDILTGRLEELTTIFDTL